MNSRTTLSRRGSCDFFMRFMRASTLRFGSGQAGSRFNGRFLTLNRADRDSRPPRIQDLIRVDRKCDSGECVGFLRCERIFVQ